MNPIHPIETAYAAVRILVKSGTGKWPCGADLHNAERVFLGMIHPERVTGLEIEIAAAAEQYRASVQAAKYAAVNP